MHTVHIHTHLTSCNSSSAVCNLIHDYMLARMRYTQCTYERHRCVSTLPHINQRGCTHTMTYMYYTHTCKHTQRHLMAQSVMLSLSLMKNERTALFVYSQVCFWLSCLFSTPVLLHRYFVKAEENISLQVCFCDEVPQVKPSCIHVMSTCSNYYPYAVNKRSTSRCTQEQCILYTPCSFSD